MLSDQIYQEDILALPGHSLGPEKEPRQAR